MDEEELAEYIRRIWPMFEVKTKVPLRELFPEPEKLGMKRLWNYGHADVAVFKDGKLIAVLEPGGAHHFDEQQAARDRRKYMLCKLNNVTCLHFVTGLPERLSKRKFRNMIRKALFAKV